MPVLRVRAEQRAIADHVDHARHAAREAINLAQRERREDVGGRSGDAQAVANVRDGFVARERVQVIAPGDALCELAQLVAREQLAQLRLADEDDLQQFLGIGLEVGEQAYLLQHFGREVLRLIDHQHDAASSAVRAQQVVVEDVDEVLATADRLVRHADADLLAQCQQELGRSHARVEHQRDLGILGGLREQGADDGGLARAHLAGQLHEAAGFLDAVQQMSQGFGVALAQIEIARIRGDREGLFVEAEEGQIHGGGSIAWAVEGLRPGGSQSSLP